MIPVPGYDIRFSEPEDLASMQAWFALPGACDEYPFDATEQDNALKNWIGFAKFKASLTGTIEGVPCSVGTLFLMPYRKVAHHCPFYLAVDPAHRRKGIGTSMLRNLLHLAQTRFRLEGLYVEVYEPSPLTSILKQQRFELLVRQENYVKTAHGHRARLVWGHFFQPEGT